MEKFKELKFDCKYKISNLGRIINSKTNKELKCNINKNGYRYVQLSTNGKRRTYRIHRLVADTFLENPYNLPYVNHKDGNKLNNNVDNLEWISARDNNIHARENGLIKDNKPIISINMKTSEIIKFKSLSEAGRYYNINTAYIHRALNKTYNKNNYNGYIFKYIQE